MKQAEEIHVSREELVRLTRQMSHWVNVAKELYGSTDETFILRMLRTELETKKRYYIVQRIYAHYNAVRRKRELEEIRAWNRRKPLSVTLESMSLSSEDIA